MYSERATGRSSGQRVSGSSRETTKHEKEAAYTAGRGLLLLATVAN